MWPRASAVAERLWSRGAAPSAPLDLDLPCATRRLQAHRCRLLGRGIPAAPMNPPWGR